MIRRARQPAVARALAASRRRPPTSRRRPTADEPESHTRPARSPRSRPPRALVVAIAAALAIAACSGGPEPVSLAYFYFPGCATCPDTIRLEQLAGELYQVGRSHEGMSVRIYDVRGVEEWEHLRRLGAEYGVDVDSLHFPILFAAGEVYDGLEEIQAYVDSH